MAVNLASELKAIGCEMPADEFRDLLMELHAVLYPSWSIDELVCHPQEALEYAIIIRRRAKCSYLPDDLILRSLMNCRRRAAESGA